MLDSSRHKYCGDSKLVKTIARILGHCFKINLRGNAIRLQQVWYDSSLLNRVRRGIGPAILTLKWKIDTKRRKPLRLHLGCGNQHIRGYVNIDWRKTTATDLVCDIKKLPYKDDSAELIETYHVIEHLPRHDLMKALKEWRRVLTPAGKLVIECPDFDEDVREYMEGNEERLDSIFGLQRFPGDSHLFGYNFQRLENLLRDVGFEDIQRREPQDYHSKSEPCLRVECIKGDKA
jgi:predicted SAM-dependent methyltransferase